MTERKAIELPVVDVTNAEVGRVVLPAAFSMRISDALMFEQVLAQRASRRRGTASTKSRGEIRGGGKKPWRQKGTGRARAGSTRSPIWRGGGTIFGPKPRSYAYRLPRKARLAALGSVLAQKARDGEVRIIDAFGFDEPKTKKMRSLLESLKIETSVLVVIADRDSAVELSARNLHRVAVMPVAGLNVYDILRYKILLISKDALEGIEGRLAT